MNNLTTNWTFNAKASFAFYSPTVGRDGTIYIGNSNGKLYAIKGTGRLAASAWPMFGHDLQHTGNASTGISPLRFLSAAFINGTFKSTLAGTPGSPGAFITRSIRRSWRANPMGPGFRQQPRWPVSSPVTSCRRARGTRRRSARVTD